MLTSKKILKVLLLIIVLASHRVSYSQFTFEVVRDKMVNGQLKRMVFQKWNDWQPSPKGNIMGMLFWQIGNRRYYRGEDQRPFRLPTGPFILNYADLTLQERTDNKIMDTTEKISKTHLATHLNMSGEEADIAYTLFFNKKFRQIYEQVDEFINGMRQEAPRALEACLNSSYFNDFMEYLEVTKDRVKATHEAFVDKGVRLEAYLTIYKELSEKYKVFSHYLSAQVLLSRIPTPKDLELKGEVPVLNNDREIVRYILSNYKF